MNMRFTFGIKLVNLKKKLVNAKILKVSYYKYSSKGYDKE